MLKLPGRISNEVAVMNFWDRLPCAWRNKCISPGSGCNHLVAQECLGIVVDTGAALQENLAASCPLFEHQKLLQLPEADCSQCQACAKI